MLNLTLIKKIALTLEIIFLGLCMQSRSFRFSYSIELHQIAILKMGVEMIIIK